MKLTVLGSGSSGNCYLLTSSTGEVLILEAGVPVKKVIEALNYNFLCIKGCLISHSHGDHAKHQFEFELNGIECFFNPEAKKSFFIGSYQIMPFEAKHDVPCSGFLIWHKECGMICFLTDSYYSQYTFPKCNHYIIEANYCESMVSGRDDYRTNRLFTSHLSIQTCKKILQANDLSKTKTVTLIHLSEWNSNEIDFVNQVQEITKAKVRAAAKGLEVDLSLIPF